MRPVFSVALLVAAGGCGPLQCGRSEARATARIAAWEQRRSLGAGTLTTWARDPMMPPSVRARALLALARVQDLDTAPTVAEACSDPDAEPRAMAAFAAGVLGLAWEGAPEPVRAQLADAVLAAESRELDGAARLQQLAALGRLRTPAALDRLVQRLAAEPEVAERAATALGVAARAKAAWPQTATPLLTGRLGAASPEALRWAVVYALGYAASPEARRALLGALSDASWEVRAVAAKGLAEQAVQADADALGALLTDPAPGAEAEAARSLAKLAARCPASEPCPALEALGGLEPLVDRLARGDVRHSVPPLLALAQTGVPPAGGGLLGSLRSRVRAAFARASTAARADLAWIDCRLAAAQDRNSGWLDETPGCGAGLVPEVRRLKLGLDEVAQSPRLKARFDRATARRWLESPPDASVRVAVANVVGASHHPEAAEDVRPLVSSADPVLAAAAASAVGALGDVSAGPSVLARAERAASEPEQADAWADALAALKPAGAEPLLTRWLGASHANLRHVAARALGVLSSKPVQAPGIGPEGPRTAPAAPAVAPGIAWRLPTARGVVVIQPDVDAAPETVAQLTRLARAGFFNGLTFHRVVPDFVVQGGDPRGDGEGGPGFTLPCEVSPRRYRRGTVGMALSGKDTGGSQIFVALSPQPHLEGRYTVVGEVVDGMDSLEDVLEGDGLGTVEVIRRATDLSHR